MAIITADADLTRDRELLIGTLGRFLTPFSNGRRFDWLYINNPNGVARTWLALDADRVIGAAAAFPRKGYSDEAEVSGWVFGDFCLDPEYRSLGPALQLQRACLSVRSSAVGAFFYDFPSASMVAVYKRLGCTVSGKMIRFAKLLRVDRSVRALITVPIAQKIISGVGNTFLKLLANHGVTDLSLELSLHLGPCGEEFSNLGVRKMIRSGLFIQRSADHLNWRYVNHPFTSYEIITARRHGELVAYAVWTQNGEDASVVDLFGENNLVTVKALLDGIIDCLSSRGVMTLNIWLSESHPWLSVCSEMDFHARDSVPIVCLLGAPDHKLANGGDTRWCLMHGDRDS